MKTLLERVSGMNKRELFERTYAQLKLARANYEANWADLAAFLDPQALRTETTDVNRGDRRDQKIIDSEPRIALRTLQSGMHAGITSPARPWFKLTTADTVLAERPDVKLWLHTVQERLRTVFLRSNLYKALPICYGDLGLFGVHATALREDSKDILRAYSFPVGSYAFGLDERQIACTFVREYTMTVRQILREFGGEYGQPLVDAQVRNGEVRWENFSVTVRNLFYAGNLEARVTVVWYVAPNTDCDPGRLYAKDAMPWRSCWFELGRNDADYVAGGSGFLRESGFRLFPLVCPRWSVRGEDTYASDSPALTALGDVKQLQFMARRSAKAIDKGLDPPLVAQFVLKNQKVSELPGDVSYVDAPDVRTALSPIHEVDPRWLVAMDQLSAKVTARVRSAFYADLFLMIAESGYGGRNITAEEIRARQEEKLLALGPVLEGINDELLDPLIDRGFDIMLGAGAVPEPPEILEGVDLKVEYTSIMAQAQKLLGVTGHTRFVMEIANLAPVFPDMPHKVNQTAWVSAFGDKLGIDPAVMRSDEDAQKSIEAASQAAQQAQQAEAADTAASAAQKLGATPTKGGQSTALDDVAAMQAELGMSTEQGVGVA